MKYYEDPILGKGRAADVAGGTGGGTEYIGGFAIGISGETISRLRYMPIESVTGSSVTLMAGHAYKAYATSTAITLNTETVPANEFGLEGHIEIYVAGTGYVVTGSNVVLANALEPDAVNNCTVRFHDGIAIISVEDHVAGYIVVNGATSGEGSLYYGISTSTNDYVAFDASLNGSVIPLAGAVAEGEKHIVGNGYAETTLTGAVDCGTAKVTVANLSLQNVGITGGTMTLGDAYIPSGSTVAVSGGGLAVEKVTGNGGTIDLGGKQLYYAYTSGSFNGVSFVSGSATNGGVARMTRAIVSMTNTTVTNNIADNYGGGMFLTSSSVVSMTSVTISGNYATSRGGGVFAISSSVVSMTDTTVIGNAANDGADIYLSPNCSLCVGGNARIGECEGVSATVVISSGASINLTSSIAPGGAIQVVGGTCTINGNVIESGTYTSIDSNGQPT